MHCLQWLTRALASAAVTQAQYNADAGTCASLGTTALTPTTLQPVFNIRASSDPLALANDLTGCSTLFGPTAKSYRISGVGLLIVRALCLRCALCLLLTPSLAPQAGVMITALMLFIVVKKFCLSKPQQQQVLPAWEMGSGPFPKAPQQQLPPSYAPGGFAQPQPGYAQGYAPQGYASQPPQQQYGAPPPQYGQAPYPPPQRGGYAPQGYAAQPAYSAPGYAQY